MTMPNECRHGDNPAECISCQMLASRPSKTEPTLTCSEVAERLRHECISFENNGDIFMFDRTKAEAILHSWRERRVQELEEALKFAIADRDKYKAKLNNEYRASIGEVWHWQNDECDNLESLVCPILISANDLRAIALRNVVLAEAAEALRKISGKAQDNPWETAYCDGVFDGVEDCIDVLEELKI